MLHVRICAGGRRKRRSLPRSPFRYMFRAAGRKPNAIYFGDSLRFEPYQPPRVSVRFQYFGKPDANAWRLIIKSRASSNRNSLA